MKFSYVGCLVIQERYIDIRIHYRPWYKIIKIEKALEIRQHPIPSEAALFLHVFLKLAVIVFFYFQDILDYAIGKMLNREIMIFFIILDFWFTKNYNGRKLLGIRWYFSLDKYNNERFFF